MKKAIAILTIGLVTWGCDTKNPNQIEAGGNPDSIYKDPSPPALKEVVEVTLTRNDEVKAFKSIFITEEMMAGSAVPQLTFFEAEVGCEARTDLDIPRFFAAFASEPGVPVGEYDSPNWGYSGIPGFVPGSPDQADPRDSWGKVTVTSSDAKTVRGTLRYESNGVLVSGEFNATRCPASN